MRKRLFVRFNLFVLPSAIIGIVQGIIGDNQGVVTIAILSVILMRINLFKLRRTKLFSIHLPIMSILIILVSFSWGVINGIALFVEPACYTYPAPMIEHSYLTHLECSECDQVYDSSELQTYCHECNSPLLVRYDLMKIMEHVSPAVLSSRQRGMWRWAEMLPVIDPAFRISLGEGDSPMLHLKRLGDNLSLSNLILKDESSNPTGTFKARGLSAAVSRAIELGVQRFVIPTAGNAGGALAVYCARAGVEAHIFMPRDAPKINQAEVLQAGAKLTLVDGLINDAGRMAAELAGQDGWFDVSTLKEPYRLEGKKTLGLEIAEYFDWSLPDVIVYPTGGGTGLIGMWKAFDELESLGWIDDLRPRMVAVQAKGCAPVVKAFMNGDHDTEMWENAETDASGLRVPHPFAGKLILRTLRESNGIAIAVSEDEIARAQKQLSSVEGVLAAPEGAATLACIRPLLKSGWLEPSERILLLNTGSGLKYI